MTSPSDLFAGLPQELPGELLTTLLNAASVRVERIVSYGHASPDGLWDDQEQHEWVALWKGAVKPRFEDPAVELKRGDFINTPAFTKHRVEGTTPDEPTVWLGLRHGEGR
jgi:cupin 2 domain-containing protein